MVEIECAGEMLQLFPEKAIFWPRQAMLIVADLHLGKPAAFRQSGIAVPEQTTVADLERIEALVRITGSQSLAILGDLFHAAEGMQPEMLEAVTQWRARNAELEIILVPGNHDLKSGPPPLNWDVQSVTQVNLIGPFALVHQPMVIPGRYVLSGHLHPAIVLRERFGGGLRMPCFCFGEECAVLPAFGSFTGMSNVEPETMGRIFGINSRENLIVEIIRKGRS